MRSKGFTTGAATRVSIGKRCRAECAVMRSMEKKSRGPSQRRNERWRRKERLERRRRQRKRGNFKEGSSHVGNRVGNGIKNAKLSARLQRGGGALRQKGIDEANKRGVDIARAFGSEGKEDIIRIDVMF